MQNLLVLGLIPGTNIAVSFQAWLLIMAVFPFVMRLAKPPVERQFGKAVVTFVFCYACYFGFAGTKHSLI